MGHTWDFSPVWQHANVLVDGLTVTFALTVLSCGAGTLLAIPLAIGLTSAGAGSRRTLTFVVELVRACPPLAGLIWAYYLLPWITGIALTPFTTAVTVFTLSFAAFAADVFRGGIEGISQGTRDAAIALGMTRTMVIRRVVIPEVFRRSFPALNALIVNWLKMSSLASVISVPELLYAATLILTARPRPFEIYTAVAAAYVAVIIPIVLVLRWLERTRWFALEPANPR